ncbi:hypothetical protein [uncultured Polaribacter sp.]|uniref:hypothetical protein n=1 Tax=uncultured Polaribacter sp. TaxID=174711 RepID=UPI0026170FAF|nr:hypothetical protein [uncultured Polaribacter sp.]
MILSISPSNNQVPKEASHVDAQLILVIIGLAIGVFMIIKIAKFFSKMKGVKKPNFASFF